MRLSKEVTNYFHILLDQLLPPILRDSKWFMAIPFKFLFGDKYLLFMNFKENAPRYSKKKFMEIYERTQSVHIKRESDLNLKCLEKIQASIVGSTVLDVGCGRGFLSGKLANKFKVTAADIVLNRNSVKNYSKVRFIRSYAENLPFRENAFATVVCSHTLEHVQNLQDTISQLRRIASKRLIIVVPKQRPYKYTFDLHLHFFPYPNSLIRALGNSDSNIYCEELNHDLVYIEEYGKFSHGK